MGIFDFLRKITKDKETEEVNKESLTFSHIGNWIEKKKEEIKTKEKNLFVLIKGRISHFTHNLEEKIKIVRSVDVNTKKAEDRLKSATEDGRSKYLEALESFLENLNNLQEDRTEIIISNVNRLFSSFIKASHMSYERATILIGKEMADIKNEVKNISKDLIKVFDEHKVILDISKTISILETKLKQYEEIKKDEARASEKIASLEREIYEKEEKNKIIFEEIEKVKKSPEYLGHLKTLDENKSLKEELERDFIYLIRIIDFKALANFFHIFEDKMERVKSHRDTFHINFEKDDGKEILNLLSVAKLNTPEILDKINEINHKREILKNKIESDNDQTRELSDNIKKTILEIEDIKNSIAREQKRHEKFKASGEEILNEIKKEFEKIEVELH
ncbi:MAG TPA: hypothetical protein VJH92_04425 [Candidatus Nanoarchaeia archaeon]|nr:hypothetical protein [Candidatus Nanoarchaeia archaeon]